MIESEVSLNQFKLMSGDQVEFWLKKTYPKLFDYIESTGEQIEYFCIKRGMKEYTKHNYLGEIMFIIDNEHMHDMWMI